MKTAWISLSSRTRSNSRDVSEREVTTLQGSRQDTGLGTVEASDIGLLPTPDETSSRPALRCPRIPGSLHSSSIRSCSRPRDRVFGGPPPARQRTLGAVVRRTDFRG